MKEPKLAVTASASGNTTGSATKIDSGEFKVEAPPAAGSTQIDQLLITLKQAVTLNSSASWLDSLLATPLPLEFRLQGDLAAWHPRLATFLPLQDYRMAGIADISGNGLFATSRMQLASLAGKVQPAQFVGNGLYLNEELLQFQGQADMQLSQQQLQVSNLVIQSATLAAQVTDGQLVWSKGLVAKGNARYEANLERLQRWFYNPQTPPGQLAAGC